MSKMRREWNAFWFAPRAPGALGLFRLVFGALVVWYGLLLWPDRRIWFTDAGVMRASDVAFYLRMMNPGLRLSFPSDGPTERALVVFFAVFLIAAICLTLGLWTRLSSIVVFVGLNWLHNRCPMILNSGDTIMIVMAGYLMLSPAGAACSWDRLARILRGTEGDLPPSVSLWAQRLMQIQVTLVYLCAALSKAAGPLWQDGTAAYYPLHLPETRRFPLPFMDAHHLILINLLTYGTIAVEFALATFVWMPRLRLPVLAAGTLLHLGIEYSLNIPLFSFLMIASYITFLRQSDLETFLARFRPSRRALHLVYDGECDFCRSALLIVRFFDVFRLVTFLDSHQPEELAQADVVTYEEAQNAAIAVDKRERKWAGFFAFRVLAWRLPATWLLAPFLYLPGVSFLGTRVYTWVTKNRSWLPVAARFRG